MDERLGVVRRARLCGTVDRRVCAHYHFAVGAGGLWHSVVALSVCVALCDRARVFGGAGSDARTVEDAVLLYVESVGGHFLCRDVLLRPFPVRAGVEDEGCGPFADGGRGVDGPASLSERLQERAGGHLNAAVIINSSSSQC